MNYHSCDECVKTYPGNDVKVGNAHCNTCETIDIRKALWIVCDECFKKGINGIEWRCKNHRSFPQSKN